MLGLPPLTPKQASNQVLNDHISKSIDNYQAGDLAGATAEFAHVVAVSAAYAVGTLVGFGSKYAISGLNSAISALSKSPSGLGAMLLKLDVISDPLVAQRLTNVGKAFSGGAAAAYL